MELILVSWPTMILLGLALRMALRLNYGARGPDPDDPVYVFLNIGSWVLICLGLAPAILGGLLSLFGIIVVLLAAITLVEAVTQRRAAQRRSMCTMLSLLVERGAQLESSDVLAGQPMRGVVGRSAKRLFASLQSGEPLSAAVARNPAALPPEASAYLAAGNTSTSQLAALREISRGEYGELATIWRSCIDRISYLSSVLLMMTGVLTFLMIKIVPEFNKIFEEFDIELPTVTQLAVVLSQFSVTYLAVPLMIVLLLLVLAAIVIGICYLCDIPVLKGIADRIFRGRRTADVLRILAIAVDQREPLSDVLQQVAMVYPSAATRGSLRRASMAVNAGTDWREALVGAGMINRAELGLLKTAEQVGNLPWALRAIAQRREKRAVNRLSIALQVLYPLAILLLGGLVGFYVIAMFVPIVELIQGLT